MGFGASSIGRISPTRHRLGRAIKKRSKRRIVAQVCGTFEPLLEYANDPVGFCRDILGVELTGIQVDIAEAVRDNPRVSVAACYASGKTFLAACLLLWWLYTRRPGLVVTTAPTARQVKELLWSYVRRLHKRAKIKLPGRPLTQKLEIDVDQRAFGFTGNSGHAVQGIHEAANVLFIEDESAGMKAEIVVDFEGITASTGSRHIKIGNPTSDSGPFFDTQMNPRVSKDWVSFNISAFDIINVIERRKVIPGLVEIEWVERIRSQYGEDSPFWICKVLGKFLSTAGAKVVPIEWRDLAKERWAEPRVAGKKTLGCDIGRSIDPSVFVELDGRHASVVGRMQTDDLTVISDEIERVAIETGAEVVNIDGTGLGIGVCDIIRRRRNDGTCKIPDSVVVNYCVLSRSAEEKDLFFRILDEVCWAMRRAFSPDNPDAVAINPEDEELCEEICWRGWGLDEQKFKVWPKGKIRTEYGRSCDFADALMLCFWPSQEWAVL